MNPDPAEYAEYERIFTASAQLISSDDSRWETPWRSRDWPQERIQAWWDLSHALRDSTRVTSEVGQPSNPTRHLLTRRTPDNRPVTLTDAGREWRARIENTSQMWHMGFTLLDTPELHPVPIPAGSCVIVPGTWTAYSSGIVSELKHRLTPGRPACQISAEAESLSHTLHTIADRYRGAFTGQDSTPHPATAAWIDDQPIPTLDTGDLDRLREAAHRAAWLTPTLEEWRVTRERLFPASVGKAAHHLRRVLAGDDVPFWREAHEDRDPARHVVSWAEEPDFAAEEHFLRSRLLENGPQPRVPQTDELTEPATDGFRWATVDKETTFILAEAIDEVAARIHPGRHTGTIGFDAHPTTTAISSFQKIIGGL